MRNKHIEYDNVTTNDIIRHLYDAHASIYAQDLRDNVEHLKSPYDPNLPFETLVNKVENAVEFEATDKTSFTMTQIVNAAYNFILSTGMFAECCREWRAPPYVSKTWDVFKVFSHSIPRFKANPDPNYFV